MGETRSLSKHNEIEQASLDLQFLWGLQVQVGSSKSWVGKIPTFWLYISIGGGRGQWLGGHHGECRARAYKGGGGAEPPAGSRGKAPLKLKAFWSLDVQQSRQI